MLRNSPQATVQGPAAATRLASLSLGSLTLSPAFDPEVTLYSATAPEGTQQITVDADTARTSSTAVISPEDAAPGTAGHQVALAHSAQTVVAVTVVAADGAEGTYWAVIDGPGHSPDALGVKPPLLNGLAVTGADDLGFDPAVTRYEATVDASAEAVTVIAARHDSDATVQIVTVHGDDPALTPDDSDSDPDQEGHQVSLADDGDTLVLVIVTSADERRQQIYAILISRQASGKQAPMTRVAFRRSGVGNQIGWGSPQSQVAYGKAAPRQSELPVLASLALAEATISPEFSASTTIYTAEVAAAVDVVTVTASTPEGVSYSITSPDADTETDGYQVALAEPEPGGEPTQTAIAVVARDAQNAVNVYTITVTRAPPAITIPPEGLRTQATAGSRRRHAHLLSAMAAKLPIDPEVPRVGEQPPRWDHQDRERALLRTDAEPAKRRENHCRVLPPEEGPEQHPHRGAQRRRRSAQAPLQPRQLQQRTVPVHFRHLVPRAGVRRRESGGRHLLRRGGAALQLRRSPRSYTIDVDVNS